MAVLTSFVNQGATLSLQVIILYGILLDMTSKNVFIKNLRYFVDLSNRYRVMINFDNVGLIVFPYLPLVRKRTWNAQINFTVKN